MPTSLFKIGLLLCLLASTACGQKGPLRAAGLEAPSPTNNTTAVQQGPQPADKK